MSCFRPHDRLRKICALVVATLILPVLADAGQNGQGNNQNGQGNISAVPETNPAWVLIPLFGAVLFFSSRQFFRAKADQKNGSLS